jgi:phosphoribosylformylglycinamidine synthase
MAVTGGKGLSCQITCEDTRDIFSETFSRAVVEVEDENAFEDFASKQHIPYTKIGKTGGDKFICNEISRPLDTLQNTFFQKFQEVIEQDL